MITERCNQLNTCYGIVAILLWSSVFCLSRSLMEKIGMFTAAGAIYLLGGIISLLFYRIVRQRNPNCGKIRFSFRHLVFCGLPFVLYMLCLYLAIGLAKSRQQVIEVGLLNYLWPTFTLIFSVPLLKNRVNFWLLPGTVVALSGIVLANIVINGLRLSISDLWVNCSNNAVPYLLGGTAAILWGLYSNLARRYAAEGNVYSVPIFLLATGVLLEIIKCFFPEQSTWSRGALAELGVIVIFPTIAAYVMWDSAMRRGNLLLVASLAYFAPLLSTMVSGLYLGVRLTGGIWIACCLVMVGALISKMSLKEKAVVKE